MEQTKQGKFKSIRWILPAVLGLFSGMLGSSFLQASIQQYKLIAESGFHWLTFFQLQGGSANTLGNDGLSIYSSHQAYTIFLISSLVFFLLVLPLLWSSISGGTGWQGTVIFGVAYALIGLFSSHKALYFATMIFALFPAIGSYLSVKNKCNGFWGVNVVSLSALIGTLVAFGVYTLMSGESAIAMLFSNIASEAGDVISQQSKVMSYNLFATGYVSPDVGSALFRSQAFSLLFSLGMLLGFLGWLLAESIAKKTGNSTQKVPFSNWRIPSPIVGILCGLCIVGFFLSALPYSAITVATNCLFSIFSFYLIIQGLATLVFITRTMRNPMLLIFAIVLSLLFRSIWIFSIIGMLEQIMQIRASMQLSIFASLIPPRKGKDGKPGENSSNENDPQDINDLLNQLRGIDPEDFSKLTRKDDDDDFDDSLHIGDEELDPLESIKLLTPDELIQIEEARKKKEEDSKDKDSSDPQKNNGAEGEDDASKPRQ